MAWWVGILSLSILLLVCLTWLSVYVFVIISASWRRLWFLFFDLKATLNWICKLLEWLLCLLKLTLNQINDDGFFNCFSVHVRVHYKGLAIRKKHQTHWVYLASSGIGISSVWCCNLVSFLAALRHLLRCNSALLATSNILCLTRWLLRWWSTLLLLLYLRLYLETQTCRIALKQGYHMLLEIFLRRLHHLREVVLIRQFNNFNHFTRISNPLENTQIVKIAEVNYLFECLILYLSFEIDYDFSVGAFVADLGYLRIHVFFQEIT